MMTFTAGDGAKTVLRGWIAVTGLLLCLLFGALAGLFTPWLLLLDLLTVIMTALAFWWYPPRYTACLNGSFDGTAVRASKGVFWQRDLFVPMTALRTFERWETPLLRHRHCCVLILRFAGGSAVLPLLSRQEADTLVDLLEAAEE